MIEPDQRVGIIIASGRSLVCAFYELTPYFGMQRDDRYGELILAVLGRET